MNSLYTPVLFSESYLRVYIFAYHYFHLWVFLLLAAWQNGVDGGWLGTTSSDSYNLCKLGSSGIELASDDERNFNLKFVVRIRDGAVLA